MDKERTDKKRVLVVDDEANHLNVVIHVLEKRGFECRGAHDGLEALKVMEKFMPDLMILDIMMPYMDGYELFRILKEKDETRDLPVMVMTAVNNDTGKKSWETIVDYYITKPFKIDELLEGVHSLLC